MLSFLSGLFAGVSGTVLAAPDGNPSVSEESFRQRFVAASLETVRKNYRKAAGIYLQLLQEKPSSAALNYALSKAYLGLGAADSARIYAERTFQLEPSNKYYIGYLAALSHQANDFARAAVLFRQLADLEPGSVEALAMLALEYLAADSPDKALGVFREILGIDPKNDAARAQVLLMQIQLGHYQDAIGTISGFAATGDAQDKLRLTLGELYTQTRQYDLASSTLNALLLDRPAFLPAWLSLLELSVQSREKGTFRRDLSRFYGSGDIVMKDKVELSNLFFARSLKDSLYVEPAVFMASELRRLYPKKADVFLLSGRVEIHKKHPFEAELMLRKAVRLDPGNVDMREELVSSLMLQKKYPEARKELFRAEQRMPSMKLRLSVLRGELLYRTGELVKSAALLEKALRRREIRSRKWLYLQAAGTLAFCYDQLHKPKRSIDLYERILEVDPGNVLMMNNLAYTLALEGRELERARELALKVTGLEPANAGFLDTLGWIYFMLGEYAKAREILEKAAALDSSEPEILEHLGDACEKLGEMEKARIAREKASMLRAGKQ